MIHERVSTGSARSTRERLLAVAFELLLEQGYRDTTVQAVARRAGLTIGAIYANFENRHQLLAEAALNAWDVQPTASDVFHDDLPLDTVMEMVAYQLSLPATPQHRLLTEITGASMPEMKDDSPILRNLHSLDNLVRKMVAAAQARGDIDPELPSEPLVNHLVNLLLGAITSKALGLPQPTFDESLTVLRRTIRALAPEHRDEHEVATPGTAASAATSPSGPTAS